MSDGESSLPFSVVNNVLEQHLKPSALDVSMAPPSQPSFQLFFSLFYSVQVVGEIGQALYMSFEPFFSLFL